MSYDYSPNPLAGLLVGSTTPDVELPSDGDLRDAQSVDAPFEAILDSLACLHTGDPQFRGDPDFYGDVTFAPPSEVTFFGCDVDFIGDGLLGHCVVTFQDLTDVEVADGATWVFRGGVDLDGSLAIFHVKNSATNGGLRIETTGKLLLFSDTNEIRSGGELTVKSGADITFEDGGTLHLFDGSNEVGDGGILNFRDGSRLDVEGGADIMVRADAQLRVFGSGPELAPQFNDVQFDADALFQNNAYTFQGGNIYLGTGSISHRNSTGPNSTATIQTGLVDILEVPNLTANRIWTLDRPDPLSLLIPNHVLEIVKHDAEETNSLTIKNHDGSTIKVVAPESSATRNHWYMRLHYDSDWKILTYREQLL